MTSQKKNINTEVDWNQLDTFLANQYEADYGQYFSTTPDTFVADQYEADYGQYFSTTPGTSFNSFNRIS